MQNGPGSRFLSLCCTSGASACGWSTLVAMLMSLMAGACGGAGTSAAKGIGDRPRAFGDLEQVANLGKSGHHRCLNASVPYSLPPGEWLSTGWWSTAPSAPEHFAADALLSDAPGSPSASVQANFKLNQGALRHTPSGEKVVAYLDVCEPELKELATLTADEKGNVWLPLTLSDVPGYGSFRLHFRLVAHGSWTSALVSVFKEGTEFVIFDVDETLTTSDAEVMKQLVAELFGPITQKVHVPLARAGATQITQVRQRQGYEVLYLSGRPWFLVGFTREWLANGGFASGPIVHAPEMGQVVPTVSGVGAWKVSELERLKKMGFRPVLAYGNAHTDVFAYRKAGILAENTHIVGKRSGGSRAEGMVALGNDFLDHLKEICSDCAASDQSAGRGKPAVALPDANAQ